MFKKMKIKVLVLAFMFVLLGSVSSKALQLETAASHAFMIDVNTGSVLIDKNSDKIMPTSSMSKEERDAVY